MFHPCLFSVHAPWIVVKTASIINEPINSLHWFLLSCQSDGEPAGGELGHCLRSAFTLNQHFVGLRSPGETAGLGAECWCSQFMVMMSFLLPEKPHMPRWGSVPSWGMPLEIKLWGRKGKGCTSMQAHNQSLLTYSEGGLGRRLKGSSGRKNRRRWRLICEWYNLGISFVQYL